MSNASPKVRDRTKRASVLLSLRQWRSNTPSVELRRERSAECGFYRAADQIPPIVDHTCRYIEQYALQSEGLFRVTGSQEDVRALKDRYDRGKRVELTKDIPADTVASLLKLFFNELTNPVLSYELYLSFMAAVDLQNEALRLWCVRRSVDVLPPGNRAVISRVCAMFQAVTRFADDNKMTAKNIALVMSPSMFRDRQNNVLEFVSTGGLRVRLLEILVVHYDDLFMLTKEQLEAQVKDAQAQLTNEDKKKLEKFSTLLSQGAIELASNLMREGETEYKFQFDQDDRLLNLPAPAAATARQNPADLSFEEFQRQLASNPHLSGAFPSMPLRGGPPPGAEQTRIGRWQSMSCLPLEDFSEETTDEGGAPHSSRDSPKREVSEQLASPASSGTGKRYKTRFRPKKTAKGRVHRSTSHTHAEGSTASPDGPRRPRKHHTPKKSASAGPTTLSAESSRDD